MSWQVGGFEIVGDGALVQRHANGDVGAAVAEQVNKALAQAGLPPQPVIALPPRPMLQQTPPQEHAPRQQLPIPITLVAPGASVPVLVRTQRAFRADRLILVSTAGAASVVVVSQFNVGAEPQFAATGSIPIQMFAPTAFDAYIRATTAVPGIDINLVFQHLVPLGAAETISGAFLGPAIVM